MIATDAPVQAAGEDADDDPQILESEGCQNSELNIEIWGYAAQAPTPIAPRRRMVPFACLVEFR